MTRGGRTRLVAGVAGLALLALLATLAFALARGVGGAAEGRTEAAFTQAPDFGARRLDAEAGTFILGEHASGPVFIYFWASWCAPCREEAPLIESLWPEYQERGYTFVGVNMWDAESDARRFLEEFPLSFPVVADGGSGIYVDYGVQALPTAFFLDPGLEVRARYDGRFDEAALRGLLDEIGGEAAARLP